MRREIVFPLKFLKVWEVLSIEIISSIIIMFTNFQCFRYTIFEIGFGQDGGSVKNLAHLVFFGQNLRLALLWMEMKKLLCHSKYIVDHRIKNRPSLLDPLLRIFLLEVYELLGRDNRVPFRESKIKLGYINMYPI